MQLRYLRNQPINITPESGGRSPAVSDQLRHRHRIAVNPMAIQCLLIPRIPVKSFKHLGDLSLILNLADTCECEECLRGEQSVCGQE